ncbi:MAG: hypothetical protein HKN72_00080 [Gemmatimonadetes bacterium]|nr:CDP-alcohol phosphatidyltransferase family protein [Gemmatimonadota bacterium]NNF11591.1 hypothetical protein [Gemmatimonadota bacterium]
MRAVLWFLTFARLAFVPIFLWVGAAAQEAARSGGDPTALRWTAIGILFTMGVTDVADGVIARRYGLTSQIGAVVDAAADKVAQAAFLVFFAVSEGPVFTALPLLFVAVIFGRDILGLVGWLTLRAWYGPIVIVHSWHGKATTGAVAFVLVCAALAVPPRWLNPVLLCTGFLALASVLGYFFEGRRRGRAAAA